MASPLIRAPVAAIGQACHRFGRTFLVRPRGERARKDRRRAGTYFLLAALAITLAGGGLRASYLDHPMRYDESMVYFKYLVLPLQDVVTKYDDVQNHLLHTMLQHEALRWLGNRPPVLRLPAFLAGTALIPLSIALGYVLTRRGWHALLAGGLVAVSSLLVDYSTNGRGYTMVCALTLGMCLCCVQLIERPGGRRVWVVWAMLGTLGALTIPIMLFPVAGLAVVIGADAMGFKRPRRRRVQLIRLLISLVLMGGMTLLLYAPAMIRVGTAGLAHAGSRVSDFSHRWIGSPTQNAAATWKQWTQDVSLLALVLAGAGLMCCLWCAFRRRGLIWVMPWVMLVVGLAVASFGPVNPYPRVWIYLLPVFLTFAVCGLSALRPRTLRATVTVVMIVGIGLSAGHTARREHLIAEDPNTLLDAEDIARSLLDRPDREFAVLTKPSTYAIRYYADLHGWPKDTHPTRPQVREAFVVVNRGQTLEEVLQTKLEHLADYGPPERFQQMPHSTVYRLAAGKESGASASARHSPSP